MFEFQVGVTSWGIECGKKDYPGVYADVQKALCFVDYAARCGKHADISDLSFSGCDFWGEEKYCEIKRELKEIFSTQVIFNHVAYFFVD